MNSISGKITNIDVDGALSLVHVDVNGQCIRSIIIDTPDTVDYLEEGREINVVFKETEVILALKKDVTISLQNQFLGTVKELTIRNLLSRVVIDSPLGPITSIITSKAVESLKIKVESEVVAMVKTNEVMLS